MTITNTAATHPIHATRQLGQSIWLDNLRRSLVTSGQLQDLIRRDGITGITSNPSIFEKAIAGSTDYDTAIQALVAEGVGDAKAIYERLAVEDIQAAADLLRPVYDETEGRDGYVSLEVSPYLAHDATGTIDEARRLHGAVARPNVLIKVPATPAGITAIEQLIGDGIPINVTLIFALSAYEAVARAFMRGLRSFLDNGGDPKRMASVASFFVSRIDAAVDARLAARAPDAGDAASRARADACRGQAAIANAKVAYARFQALTASDDWQALAARGARPQRVLWASTGTKDPSVPKTRYVEALIGPDTVDTVPDETFRAFASGGRAKLTLTEDVDEAHRALEALAAAGVSLDEVTAELLDKGLTAFSTSFDQLLGAIARKRQDQLGDAVARQRLSLGEAAPAVEAELERWRTEGRVRRLWATDASLWTGRDEAEWLGWLHAPSHSAQALDHLEQIGRDGTPFSHVVLLGMGGSSLGPWVLRQTFGTRPGHPELVILDSVDPEQIRQVESAIDLQRSLFIVASKSGSTLEPNALRAHFAETLRAAGVEPAGSRFIAITDPGTSLERAARAEPFRHICPGPPDVGGRFSALTGFGLVPAALMGLSVSDFLEQTEIMVQACAASVPPQENPGVTLGVALGVLGRRGRDKITIVADPPVETLGAWLEQLIAESTGKHGKGLVPIDGEPIGPPEAYGSDRVFVHVRTRSSAGSSDAALATLETAGHPVIRILLADPEQLGQEFFRWEVATAVAGSVLELNPFDQPDVEAAKIASRRLMEARDRGETPEQAEPLAVSGPVRLFADASNASALGTGRSAADIVKAHLARLEPGDYLAINAFMPMTRDHDRELAALRTAVRDRARVATTVGYGPRFLHSTGQLHKGGPASGVFLVIVSDDRADLPVPGATYTFGDIKRAQALGDCEVLAERGRRLLRVETSSDTVTALRHLRELAGL
jgi:transaldolase/glucose-6-phosphate isomerase